MSIFVLGKKLGKGSFGSVYEVETDLGKKYAAKTIDTTVDRNYNYIIEASISATYNHPNIVHCKEIFIENKKLYIIQEKAIGDLMMLSRNNPIKLKKSLKYIYSIAKAIKFLHSRNIIHGDVKASNVFLYGDGTVKLGDFSVSLISLRNKYTHKISTPSHSPPECFNKEKWSFPIDMWCFGCTIYEIIYGMNIFPIQKETEDFDKMDMLKLCIFEWLIRNEKISISISVENGSDIDLNSLPIRKVRYTKLFYKKEYKIVNDLIMKLLRCEPDKRLKTDVILKHPFFLSEINVDNTEKMSLSILKNKKYDLKPEEIEKLNSYPVDPEIIEIASKILSLCSEEFKEQNKNDVNEMCIVVSYVINKLKIPPAFRIYDPEKLMSYLGYSIHESLS